MPKSALKNSSTDLALISKTTRSVRFAFDNPSVSNAVTPAASTSEASSESLNEQNAVNQSSQASVYIPLPVETIPAYQSQLDELILAVGVLECDRDALATLLKVIFDFHLKHHQNPRFLVPALSEIRTQALFLAECEEYREYIDTQTTHAVKAHSGMFFQSYKALMQNKEENLDYYDATTPALDYFKNCLFTHLVQLEVFYPDDTVYVEKLFMHLNKRLELFQSYSLSNNSLTASP